VEKDGGGGEGLQAKSSGKGPKKGLDDAVLVAASSKKSKKSKKTAASKKPPPTNSHFHSTGIMCKCDAVARTTRTMKTMSGLSFGGESLDPDGSVSSRAQQNILMPVLHMTVTKAIGGALGFSEIDPQTDNCLNKRGSVDPQVACGIVIEGNVLAARVSMQNRCVVIASLLAPERFANPDKKLAHVLKHIVVHYPETNGDKLVRMRILQNHPRHVFANANLKSLLGSHNTRCLVEHRIAAPFPVSDSIVMAEEDPIFPSWPQNGNGR